MQDGVQNHYIGQLTTGKSPLTRTKLLICGAAGVGKTELIDSLKCGRLQSLFRKRAVSDLSHMIFKRTYGMSVQQLSISNVGDFSVWDFSGLKDYYVAHEHFLETRNTIILILFSLRDPFQKQIAQVRFWLAMIKAKQKPSSVIHFAGRKARKSPVLLVGSFADQQQLSLLFQRGRDSNDIFAAPLASSILQQQSDQHHPSNSSAVLEAMVKDFGEHFVFEDHVHSLDCRLSYSREIRVLKERLGAMRQHVLGVRYMLIQSNLGYPNT